MPDAVSTFEAHRPTLLALAYRMLGGLAQAEDVVQDAWLRWQRHHEGVESPRAFLLTMVTRLCLDELGSARKRSEEARGDQLPEPVEIEYTGLAQLERLDQISIAFMVLLQRLTAAERAVFLLHDVFDMGHREIGERLGKTEIACRQLLKRARANVAAERRVFEAKPEEHRRLFDAFVAAMSTGDESALERLLAEDAILIVDPGAATHYGRIRALGGPVVGAQRILSIVRRFLSEDTSVRSTFVTRMLNGEPGLVTILDGRITSATSIAVADGRIRHLFVQYDAGRLSRITIEA